MMIKYLNLCDIFKAYSHYESIYNGRKLICIVCIHTEYVLTTIHFELPLGSPQWCAHTKSKKARFQLHGENIFELLLLFKSFVTKALNYFYTNLHASLRMYPLVINIMLCLVYI